MNIVRDTSTASKPQGDFGLLRRAGAAEACACVPLMPDGTAQVWCDAQELQRHAPVAY